MFTICIIVMAVAYLASVFNSSVQSEDNIVGKVHYLDSPFFTAGDKLYMVGHQNGTFPDLGWHVQGEMGGIWCHPIKLMDGFNASIELGEEILKLDKAKSFTKQRTAAAAPEPRCRPPRAHRRRPPGRSVHPRPPGARRSRS